MSQALLSIRDLHVELPTPSGPVEVLGGVNYHVDRGEVLGVVGESGSGKSITAMTVLGLLPPGARVTRGSVEFDGLELTTLGRRELRRLRGRRISIIFQDPMTTLDPLARVGDQIAEGFHIHHPRAPRGAGFDRAVELLELVGVQDAARRARQYPHEWSGGMRQRAVIAMALVNDPELLIADEPTTALDATVQAQVLDVLMSARERFGVSVVFITHDLGLIAQVADRAAVMYAGRVVEVAPVNSLFADSRHPYARALLASRPGSTAPRTALPIIPGRPPRSSQTESACAFAPRCPAVQKSDRCLRETPALVTPAGASATRSSACHYRDSLELEMAR